MSDADILKQILAVLERGERLPPVDPCAATIYRRTRSFTTRLAYPSTQRSGLVVEIKEVLGWDDARKLRTVLDAYIARETQ